MSTAAFHPAHPSPAKRRAVVLGASLSGLLAARGLSEHFDEVVLLERDELPAGAALRKGTPHAVHAHGLLPEHRWPRWPSAAAALCHAGPTGTAISPSSGQGV